MHFSLRPAPSRYSEYHLLLPMSVVDYMLVYPHFNTTVWIVTLGFAFDIDIQTFMVTFECKLKLRVYLYTNFCCDFIHRVSYFTCFFSILCAPFCATVVVISSELTTGMSLVFYYSPELRNTKFATLF